MHGTEGPKHKKKKTGEYDIETHEIQTLVLTASEQSLFILHI